MRRCMFALLALSLAACADRPLPFPLPVVDAGAIPMDAGPPLTTPDTLTHVCLLIGACGFSKPATVLPQVSYASLSDCVLQGDSGAFSGEMDCLKSAPDCATAASCFNGGRPQQPCPTSGVGACDGNDLLTCLANTTLTRRTDCAAQGLSCLVGAAGARCAEGTCDSQTQDFVCLGNSQFLCVKNLLVAAEDCGAEGGTCEMIPPGIDPIPEGKCVGVPMSDPCAGHARGDGVCEGSNLVICGGGSYSCGPTAGYCQNGACVTGPTCKPRCDGTVLTMCLPLPEGEVSIDCAAQGFSGCDATIGSCTM